MSKDDPYTKVELSNGLQLSITAPGQHWAFPFVIKHENEYNIRLSLGQRDAVKVLHALMQAYPLDVMAAL